MVPKDKIWDAGPETLVQLKDLIDRSKFVLWNGPLGNYEEGFSEGTKILLKLFLNQMPSPLSEEGHRCSNPRTRLNG